uniref:Acyl-protein thioesterase 1 n=1 Tax=Mycena chlorophos TaxID=658473 RepID=A0ABQ0LKL1_MYCCL|nr:phospholipase/carboxylesterase [Mycena chlorophos]
MSSLPSLLVTPILFASLAYFFSGNSTNNTPMAGIAPLASLTVPAATKHTATIIFVHGIGESASTWKPVAEKLRNDLPQVKWVLPNAPLTPFSGAGGMPIPCWFDIPAFGNQSRQDREGMLRTVYSLNKLITEEVDAGIPAERIVLGGFSQGAVMTMLTGLTGERKLGGMLVLSGFMPLRPDVKSMLSEHVKSQRIFMGHGASDRIVSYDWAVESVKWLREEIGLNTSPGDDLVGLSFNSYQGVQHTVSDQEFVDFKEWLKKALPSID